MLDSFNRRINYARISVTDRCNLRCRYCMGEDGVEKKPHCEILTIEQMQLIVDALVALGIDKIRITGGEPLVRRGVMQLIEYIGKKQEIKTLSLTTNGVLLKKYAADLKRAGVTHLNISIDSLNKYTYKYITVVGELNEVLEGIESALHVGFNKIKINAVLLKDLNDNEIESLIDYARRQDIELRFIELMPFTSQKQFYDKHYLSANQALEGNNAVRIESSTSLATMYTLDNGSTIGLIRAVSEKFCNKCNRIRITADGKLINCLHSNIMYDLKPYLSDLGKLTDYIKECVYKKPAEHLINEGILQKRGMDKIGG